MMRSAGLPEASFEDFPILFRDRKALLTVETMYHPGVMRSQTSLTEGLTNQGGSRLLTPASYCNPRYETFWATVWLYCALVLRNHDEATAREHLKGRATTQVALRRSTVA